MPFKNSNRKPRAFILWVSTLWKRNECRSWLQMKMNALFHKFATTLNFCLFHHISRQAEFITLCISQFKPWATYSFSNQLYTPVYIKFVFAWKFLLFTVSGLSCFLSLFVFIYLVWGEIKERRKVKLNQSLCCLGCMPW